MPITISTLDCSEEIKQGLVQGREYLSSTGMKCAIAEETKENFTLFEVDLEQSEYGYICDANKYIADIIAGIVLNSLEEKLVKKIVKHKYHKFTLEEREEIIITTLDYLNNSINRSKSLDRRKIMREVLNYFNNNQDMNLEGFVRFRLKEYMQQINLAIEQAADSVKIEREYNEFIELLKYFVALQDIKIPLVHVIKTEDGSFKILDKQRNVLRNNFMEGYIKELLDEDITYEDLLISALINISPGKIKLHFTDHDLTETIKEIFTERVEIISDDQKNNY